MNIYLGLSGLESLLPEASRSIEGPSIDEISQTGRASDGTLHVDMVSFKRSWSINYKIVTESIRESLLSIYNLQITNGSFLSFIIPDSAGTGTTYTVKMSPPGAGGLAQRDEFYSNSISFTLEQV